jgi:hypothetical protein
MIGGERSSAQGVTMIIRGKRGQGDCCISWECITPHPIPQPFPSRCPCFPHTQSCPAPMDPPTTPRQHRMPHSTRRSCSAPSSPPPPAPFSPRREQPGGAGRQPGAAQAAQQARLGGLGPVEPGVVHPWGVIPGGREWGKGGGSGSKDGRGVSGQGCFKLWCIECWKACVI